MTLIEILQMLFGFLAGITLTLFVLYVWAVALESDKQAELRDMQRALKAAQNDN